MISNDVVPTFEVPQKFLRSIIAGQNIKTIPDDIVKAHEELQALSFLNAILRSEASRMFPQFIGDDVRVFRRIGNEKRVKWSTPTPVLNVNSEAKVTTVSDTTGSSTCTVALDNSQIACPANNIAKMVTESIDNHN